MKTPGIRKIRHPGCQFMCIRPDDPSRTEKPFTFRARSIHPRKLRARNVNRQHEEPVMPDVRDAAAPRSLLHRVGLDPARLTSGERSVLWLAGLLVFGGFIISWRDAR